MEDCGQLGGVGGVQHRLDVRDAPLGDLPAVGDEYGGARVPTEHLRPAGKAGDKIEVFTVVCAHEVLSFALDDGSFGQIFANPVTGLLVFRSNIARGVGVLNI